MIGIDHENPRQFDLFLQKEENGGDLNSRVEIVQMSFFNSTELAPEDPIMSIPKHFKADPRDPKVNLGVGVYRTAEGKSLVLNCIRKAEARILERQMDKNYLPIDGDPAFIRELLGLAFGPSCEALKDGRLVGLQTLGGSGALSLLATLLVAEHGNTIYVGDPTWANHHPLFKRSGLTVESYRHYSYETRGLAFSEMCEDLNKLPKGSTVLFHACCHNPTGVNPTQEQWRELSDLVKKQELLPVFDCAYQGFGDGVEEDVFALRHFLEEGHEMLVAISCSKNFGLYGERVGALALVTKHADKTGRVLSQLKRMIRGTYSNPPLTGQRLVRIVLESFRSEWKQECDNMRNRIQEMRSAMVGALQSKCSGFDFQFLTHQRGMFSYSGLPAEQAQWLRDEKAIYMAPGARINIAGLTPSNIDYTTDCLAEAYSQLI